MPRSPGLRRRRDRAAYASRSALAGQSEPGAPANAFISANPKRMDRVVPGNATAPDDR